MPTYVYETIPQHENEQPVRFEVRQSMKDAPLASHPDTGKPVRRVPIGGTGLMGGGALHQRDPVGAAGRGVGVIKRPKWVLSGPIASRYYIRYRKFFPIGGLKGIIRPS